MTGKSCPLRALEPRAASTVLLFQSSLNPKHHAALSPHPKHKARAQGLQQSEVSETKGTQFVLFDMQNRRFRS
jgi:hypothetical protein